MDVITRLSDDPTVSSVSLNQRNLLFRRIQYRLAQRMKSRFQTCNPTPHSVARTSFGLGKELQKRHEQKDYDILHLHWLGNNTLSIEEIGQLSVPLVWTLHDQWAFCGAEHYTSPPQPGESASADERFAVNYSIGSRPKHESGVDLNRHTWLRKQRAWCRPIRIVCPSKWIASCARRSSLMAEWPISVIPYPINLDTWSPCDQTLARSLLALPTDRPLILFGAVGGTADQRKGADLLFNALQILRSELADSPLAQLELVVFGQSRPQNIDFGFPIHFCGRLHDDISLRLLYAASDVMVVPSRQEAFGQTASEAQACGTPVVAYRTGGLQDAVDHHVTGVLAEPFDPASLAASIRWVLEDPLRRQELGAAARRRTQRLWDPVRVAGLYAELYSQILEETCHNWHI